MRTGLDPFDQLDLLRAGDVLVLDRGYPATWLVQLLHQRGIDFIIRCDSTHSWKDARELLCGAGKTPGRAGNECWAYLATTTADKVRIWELDGPAQMRVRLVRHVSSSGRVRVLVTSLLHVQTITSLIHDCAAMMGRSLIRHVQGRNQPRKNTRHKPHPSQVYKRAA